MLLSIWFIIFNNRTSSSKILPIQSLYANLFVFLYESDLIDGSSLTIENFDRLRRDTQPVEMLIGDPLLISVVMEYPSESLISNLINKQLQIPIEFTDGLIRNVNLTFSCDQQTAKGISNFHQINEVIQSILGKLNFCFENNQKLKS